MNIIAMRCPGCSAALDVTPSIDFMNCGYCGTAARVVREGGTISLAADVLSRIQGGTDRAAAELALVRLKAELQGIESLIERTVVPPEVMAATLPKNAPEIMVYLIVIVCASVFVPFTYGVSLLPAILLIVPIEVLRIKGNQKRAIAHDEITKQKISKRRSEIEVQNNLLASLRKERATIHGQISANLEIVSRPVM